MAIQAQLYQENLGFPLFGSQDWVSDINGCGLNQFSFNAQPKNHNLYQQQQQVLLQEIQRNDKVWFNTTTTPTAHSHAMFEGQEIEQYINFQNERLRLVLQEQIKQQIATLMKKAEPKLMAILRDKEAEISQARKRTMELEHLLRKLEEENQTWQRLARENEAMVLSLNDTFERARARAASCCVDADAAAAGENDAAEDAESCCGDDREALPDNDNNNNKTKRFCRHCGCRNATVLFLPCRHFCSCKHCETFLDSCPVCAQPKKASIEALTF